MSILPPFNILFVCIGNSCRSPMAEAIAQTKYGDLMQSSSAGIAPAPIVQPQTIACLLEKDFRLDPGKKPIPLKKSDWKNAHRIVNMSGYGVLSLIPKYKGELLIWDVPDPITQPMTLYRRVRDQIEQEIDDLAASLRAR